MFSSLTQRHPSLVNIEFAMKVLLILFLNKQRKKFTNIRNYYLAL